MKEIREELNNIRNAIVVILDSIDKIESQLSPIVAIVGPRLTDEESINWSEETVTKAGVYLKDLKELTDLKEQVIMGYITSITDTSSFIKKDQTKGLVKSFTIQDESGEISVVLWDDQVAKLDGYMLGEQIQITNAWKVKVNKKGLHELHPGKFFILERVT